MHCRCCGEMAYAVTLKPQGAGITELAEGSTISQNLCDLNKGRVCSMIFNLTENTNLPLAESTAIYFHPVYQQIYFCI